MIASEHFPAFQGGLYCTTCWVPRQQVQGVNDSFFIDESEFCDVYFSGKIKAVVGETVVSVNSWREVSFSRVENKYIKRRIILCSKHAIVANAPGTLEPPPPIPKQEEGCLVPYVDSEHPVVPLKRMTSQQSSALLEGNNFNTQDPALCGTVEKVVFSESTVWVYMVSQNGGALWEVILEGKANKKYESALKYKDLILTGTGQTWSFSGLDNYGPRKIKAPEMSVTCRWIDDTDTVLRKKCTKRSFTRSPFKRDDKFAKSVYVPPQFFTVAEARNYLFSTENACPLRCTIVGALYHFSAIHGGEMWIADVSSGTVFLSFLRICTRGVLAADTVRRGAKYGTKTVMLLRDVELVPEFGIGVMDRLSQLEVFVPELSESTLNIESGIVERPFTFENQMAWAGKDFELEYATQKACKVKECIDSACTNVPPFSSLVNETVDAPINKIMLISGLVTEVLKDGPIYACSMCGKKMKRYDVQDQEPIYACMDCGNYDGTRIRRVTLALTDTITVRVLGNDALKKIEEKNGSGNLDDNQQQIVGLYLSDLPCIFYHVKNGVLKAELINST